MIQLTKDQKLEFYNTMYFSIDEPVPFFNDLYIYPALVKDYNNFQASIGCLMMDKNVISKPNELGKMIKIPNVKGIRMSYYQYLLDLMQDPTHGQPITSQFIKLLEISLHIKPGFYCPECKQEYSYTEIFDNKKEKIQEEKQKIWEDFYANNFPDMNISMEEFKPYEKDFDKVFDQKALERYLQKTTQCKTCGHKLQETISIEKDNNGIFSLSIYGEKITEDQFEELKTIILHYNILNYEGDKYIDPDLKEELEIKAKLKSGNYQSPSLEKQLACIVCSTSYTFEELKNITIRKLGLLLKTIDAKNTYYAQLQGQMSGMVTFKEDPNHWIYGKESRGIADELTDADAFTSQFSRVT